MMIIFKHVKSLLFAAVTVAVLTGCSANIPPEAPKLSEELGSRISAIQSSNLALLQTFFELKRAEVDHFIQDEWVPVFAEEFFQKPKIKKAWNTIVSENDPAERLKFIVFMGPRLQKKINEKRVELVKPLDDLERRIVEKTKAEYAQALAMNRSITGLLHSASKISQTQSRYLERIGITDEKIGSTVDMVNDTVSDLLKKGKKAEDKSEKAEKYIEKLRDLREKF